MEIEDGTAPIKNYEDSAVSHGSEVGMVLIEANEVSPTPSETEARMASVKTEEDPTVAPKSKAWMELVAVIEVSPTLLEIEAVMSGVGRDKSFVRGDLG